MNRKGTRVKGKRQRDDETVDAFHPYDLASARSRYCSDLLGFLDAACSTSMTNYAFVPPCARAQFGVFVWGYSTRYHPNLHCTHVSSTPPVTHCQSLQIVYHVHYPLFKSPPVSTSTVLSSPRSGLSLPSQTPASVFVYDLPSEGINYGDAFLSLSGVPAFDSFVSVCCAHCCCWLAVC
jgi:hypothetical protein